MKHIHGYAQHLGGIIVTHKVSIHPEDLFDLEEYEPTLCGLCNEVCWLSPNAALMHTMRPEILVLCCGCAALGIDLIQAAIPGTKFLTREVPDLSSLGNSN